MRLPRPLQKKISEMRAETWASNPTRWVGAFFPLNVASDKYAYLRVYACDLFSPFQIPLLDT